MLTLRITTFITLIGLYNLNASPLLKISGEIVNPACIKLMQPSLSEKSNVIIKSVVLDSCQHSNLAFIAGGVTVKDGKVSYYEDEKDAHSYFGYRYLGKILKGIHYIFHNGEIGAYSITQENIITDLKKNITQNVSVINKIGGSFVPCFQNAMIKDNSLIVKVKKYNQDSPTAFQCEDTIEILIIRNE